jgi:hypothetical protein
MPYPSHAVKAGRSKARSGIAGVLLRQNPPRQVSTQQKFRETHLWTELPRVPGSGIGQHWLTRPSTRAQKTEDRQHGRGYGPIRRSSTRKPPKDKNPAMTIAKLTGQRSNRRHQLNGLATQRTSRRYSDGPFSGYRQALHHFRGLQPFRPNHRDWTSRE